MVAEGISVGEGVEDILPVSSGKHEGPSVRQLPAHVRGVGGEPEGGEGRGKGVERGKGMGGARGWEGHGDERGRRAREWEG